MPALPTTVIFVLPNLAALTTHKEDCYQFHEAVKLHVMPLVNQLYESKRRKLGLDTLRPWDVEAEPAGTLPLRPFKTSEELTEKQLPVFKAEHFLPAIVYAG